MPRRLNRKESQARTRAELLRAAERLFTRKGLAASSVAEIAEAAGYTRGAFYGHFEDKEELFLALLEDRLARRLAELEELLERTDSWSDFASLVATTNERDARAQRDWFVLSLEFLLRAMRDPATRRAMARHQAAVRGAVANLIEETFSRLQVPLPADPETLAVMQVAFEQGFLTLHYVDPDAAPQTLLLDAMGLVVASADREH